MHKILKFVMLGISHLGPRNVSQLGLRVLIPGNGLQICCSACLFVLFSELLGLRGTLISMRNRPEQLSQTFSCISLLLLP